MDTPGTIIRHQPRPVPFRYGQLPGNFNANRMLQSQVVGGYRMDVPIDWRHFPGIEDCRKIMRVHIREFYALEHVELEESRRAALVAKMEGLLFQVASSLDEYMNVENLHVQVQSLIQRLHAAKANANESVPIHQVISHAYCPPFNPSTDHLVGSNTGHSEYYGLLSSQGGGFGLSTEALLGQGPTAGGYMHGQDMFLNPLKEQQPSGNIISGPLASLEKVPGYTRTWDNSGASYGLVFPQVNQQNSHGPLMQDSRLSQMNQQFCGLRNIRPAKQSGILSCSTTRNMHFELPSNQFNPVNPVALQGTSTCSGLWVSTESNPSHSGYGLVSCRKKSHVPPSLDSDHVEKRLKMDDQFFSFEAGLGHSGPCSGGTPLLSGEPHPSIDEEMQDSVTDMASVGDIGLRTFEVSPLPQVVNPCLEKESQIIELADIGLQWTQYVKERQNLAKVGVLVEDKGPIPGDSELIADSQKQLHMGSSSAGVPLLSAKSQDFKERQNLAKDSVLVEDEEAITDDSDVIADFQNQLPMDDNKFSIFGVTSVYSGSRSGGALVLSAEPRDFKERQNLAKDGVPVEDKGLMSDRVPLLSKELNSCLEEQSQILEPTINAFECMHNLSEAIQKKIREELASPGKKITCASVLEYLTAGEIIEHLSSLSESSSPGKGETEDKAEMDAANKESPTEVLNNDYVSIIHSHIIQDKGEMEDKAEMDAANTESPTEVFSNNYVSIIHSHNIQDKGEMEDKAEMDAANTESPTEVLNNNYVSIIHSPIIQDKGEMEDKAEMDAANTESPTLCQLCGKSKLSFAPPTVYCASCNKVIIYEGIYYTPLEAGEKVYICSGCYGRKTKFVQLRGGSISKTKLQKKKHNEEGVEEPWVQCERCLAWNHQICGLFNESKNVDGNAEYVCPLCCLKVINKDRRMTLRKGCAFSAKDLPRTKLSDHIERRLHERLKQEREDRAKASEKDFHEVPGAEGLVVRVVLSLNRKVHVDKQFMGIFDDLSYPSELPYKSKVITLFQKIGGTDVLLFGMYVQEYGSDCNPPNNRCVYISYLDSVKYFRPDIKSASGESLRTFVYYEIMLGYFEYCKNRGFLRVYLWACPPTRGDNFLLYCHPKFQRNPSHKLLRKWYGTMFTRASSEEIVLSSTNLKEFYLTPSGNDKLKITAARLPYFEGDFWPSNLENFLKEIDRQVAEETEKNNTLKRAHKACKHPYSDSYKDNRLIEKIVNSMKDNKEDFMVAHLQHVCTYCREVILTGKRWFCGQCSKQKPQLCERCLVAGEVHRNAEGFPVCRAKHVLSEALVDPVPCNTEEWDITIDNKFENRGSFLEFCQENHFQFDTLRRAKHSTMMILHHLNGQKVQVSRRGCSLCQEEMSIPSRTCKICPEFRACKACSMRPDFSHSHDLAKSSPADDPVPVVKLEELCQGNTMDVVLSLVLHSSQCSPSGSEPCSYNMCSKIKGLFRHTAQCSHGGPSKGCKQCQKAWVYMKLHAMHCLVSECCVPWCRKLKLKLSAQPVKPIKSGIKSLISA